MLAPIPEILKRGKAKGGNSIHYAIAFLEDEIKNLTDSMPQPTLNRLLEICVELDDIEESL